MIKGCNFSQCIWVTGIYRIVLSVYFFASGGIPEEGGYSLFGQAQAAIRIFWDNISSNKSNLDITIDV